MPPSLTELLGDYTPSSRIIQVKHATPSLFAGDSKIVCPPQEVVAAFDALATNVEHRREQIVAESRTLAALRDALLPKLIRGEILVKDAERFLRERGL